MKLKDHIHIIHTLCTASPSVYLAIVEQSSPSLCGAINEIFHNISQLSFPIHDVEVLNVLENNADIVEDLATFKGGQIRRILSRNRCLVQKGLKVTLEYVDGNHILSD